MEALFAYSASAHATRGELAPTLYSIGIVLCLALLVLWWGVVRPRR
jgi:uncharacterized protein (TIGR03382 family)